jgi:hypothetical protein
MGSLKKFFERCEKWGWGFCGAAFMSVCTLFSLWTDALKNTRIISEKFMNPFPKLINFLNLNIPLSAVSIIVLIYVFDNEWKRHRGQSLEKPGEIILFLYAMSYGTMMLLASFNFIVPSENLFKILMELLVATYLPYKYSKHQYEKNSK